MHSDTEIKLTSAEISILWRTYTSDTLSVCVIKYFIKIVKDAEVRAIYEFALQTSQQHIQTITEIFNKEGYPIPIGFTDEDVNLDAPPLFTDDFTLYNMRYLSRIGLNYYSTALPQMARRDMVEFLTGCIYSATELTRRLIDIKLKKGIYLRPPIIEIPDKVDFIDKNSFLAGFFNEKRSLIAGEVAQLFINYQSNYIGKALLTGFTQVIESSELRNYMIKGINIASKHIDIFTSKLTEGNIPVPTTPDSFITKSTEAPFSDKLMTAKIVLMTQVGMENYAIGASTSMRHDIQADFIRLSADVAKYGADGLNIMIEQGWLEQPPQAVNHAFI